MRPFRFRLARVLRVRGIEEEVARGRWLEALHAARAATSRAEDLAQAGATQEHELERLVARAPIDTRMVLAGRTVLDGLFHSARRARERARSLEFQASQQRAPWEELRRARRSLELLRERQLSAHRIEDERREAIVMDAVAIERATRAKPPIGSLDSTNELAS